MNYSALLSHTVVQFELVLKLQFSAVHWDGRGVNIYFYHPIINLVFSTTSALQSVHQFALLSKTLKLQF